MNNNVVYVCIAYRLHILGEQSEATEKTVGIEDCFAKISKYPQQSTFHMFFQDF